MRKKKIAIAGLCMAAIITTVGITAYFTDTVSIKNSFQTGIVKIDIDEWEKTPEGEEKPYEDPKTEVVPGDEISKIARITNKEVDAWIRAKVEFNFENDKLNNSLTFDDLEGIDSEKWILAEDGYFYYKNILKKGESVDLFTGVSIPSEWNNTYANCKFTVDVVADGIQAKNFTPDFESKNPWGDVEIETAYSEEESPSIEPSQSEDVPSNPSSEETSSADPSKDASSSSSESESSSNEQESESSSTTPSQEESESSDENPSEEDSIKEL